jgi:hypothetical protein
MQFIIKKSEPRVDPKRPETHPGYEKAVALSNRRAPKLEFESDGARRDYERVLASNPNNLPGLPPFFPPLQLKSYMGSPWAREYTPEERAKMTQERLRQCVIEDTAIFCTTCDRVTTHSIDMQGSFCKRCGTPKPYHH